MPDPHDRQEVTARLTGQYGSEILETLRQRNAAWASADLLLDIRDHVVDILAAVIATYPSLRPTDERAMVLGYAERTSIHLFAEGPSGALWRHLTLEYGSYIAELINRVNGLWISNGLLLDVCEFIIRRVADDLLPRSTKGPIEEKELVRRYAENTAIQLWRMRQRTEHGD